METRIMDEEKKKAIMIGIIIVCLVLAGAIFMLSRPENANTGPVQMLCVECGAEYRMEREEFKTQLLATGLVSPMNTQPIPLVCPECSNNTAFYALTCPKCKKVFVEDTQSGDYRDRCPECGHSVIEAKRGK